MKKRSNVIAIVVFCLIQLLMPGGRAETEVTGETGVENFDRADTVSTWSVLPISGTKTVGPGGDYATVTAAIADIQTQGLDGALLLELLPAYSSGGETFPLNFTNLTGLSAVNTLTLRPQAGATNCVITGSNATAIVNLDNAQFVTIDGRAGGVGTNKELTIQNTNTAGAAIRFINEASNNTVKHTIVKGVATSFTSGVIFFSTTTGANGNDNNTIDNCDIRDGATTPTNGILSQGTTTTTAQNNSNNTISNNNIFNFSASVANDSAGIRLDTGSTDWTISGNSLFQTAPRAAVTGSVRGIFINTLAGGNFTVTGNSVGGSQANAGGTAWTTTGTANVYRFVGITIRAATSSTNSVQGNTVRNIVWTSSSTNSVSPGVWCGIFLQAGSVNVGTTAGNTIGSGTGTGSVNVTTSGNLGATIGIGVSSGNTINVSNNTVGSITTNGTTTSINHSLFGILSTGFNNTFSNNTIGSTTTANSLNAATSSSFGTVTAQQVAGIQIASNATFTGNTIANLNNNYVGTASVGQIRGIVSTASNANVITNNIIRNLTTTSANTGSGNNASVIGISQVSAFATQNHTVSQNTIHTLSNINAGAVGVVGIRFDGGTSSGTKINSRNLIYGLSAGGDAGVLTGLHTKSKLRVQNNMIRLGVNAEAFSANNTINTGARAYEMTAIHDEDGKADVLFNTCFVGGTGVKSGTNNTYVIRTTKTLPNSGVWRNNVFVNERSNAMTGGKHYIAEANGTELPASDHNLFNGSGNGFRFGVLNGTDVPALQDWKGLTGLDGSSAFIDPNLVAPEAATPDLHLNQSNPAVGAGEQDPLNTVPQDFDNDPRPDPPLFSTVGADENPNFTPSIDAFPPSILYPELSKGSTSNRTLTNFATIKDNTSVPISGGSVPRIWFRRLLPTPSAWASSPGTLSGGNGMSGSWSFVIDYSLLGITPSVGETYEYYIVAQDINGNVNSNPAGANHPDVNTQSTPPPVPNSYQICPGISGIKTSCTSGCDVDGFSNMNGAFALINNSALDGNVTFKISSNSNEAGIIALMPIAHNNYPGNMVTFEPAGNMMTTHSGNVANAMICINGGDEVRFDGSFNGAGKKLTFSNTNTANPTFQIKGGANNVTISETVIEGANTDATSAVLEIRDYSGNITLDRSVVRDLSTTTGVPANLLLSRGTTGGPNTNITITDSDFINFTFIAVWFLSENNSAEVSNNLICTDGTLAFNAAENDLQAVCGATPRTTNITGLDFNGDGTINNNDIRLSTSAAATGARLKIAENASPTPKVRFFANHVFFQPPSNSTGAQIGVDSLGGNGEVDLFNNQIVISLVGSNQRVVGISNSGFGGGALNSYFNTVLLTGTASGSNSTAAYETGPSSQASEEHKNNIYFNALIGGTGNHNAFNKLNSGTPFILDYNTYFGTGAATPGDFFNVTGSQVPFAVFQSIFGGNTHSIAGNYISDVNGYFADAPNGDVNIDPGTGYDPPPPFSNAGTPIAEITTDSNGETRSATTPDIGADEFSVNRTLTTDGTLPQGNYDNITIGANFFGGFGGTGVTTTLGGIINIFGTMSVSCNSTLAGASPSNYVVGNVKKDFCAPGLFDFPVGTPNGYSPVNSGVTALGVNPSSLQIKANQGNRNGMNASQSAQRFWTLTETGDLTADLTFNYLDADVMGIESDYKLFRVNGMNAMLIPSMLNTGANTISTTNVSNLSDWAIGNALMPTAAAVSVGGRVSDVFGNAVSKARVTITGTNGETRTALTNPFGYFRFEEISVGATYILEVQHKRYQFTPQVVSVTEEIDNLNFVAAPD